ncbi:hypothetical protein [Vibrio sp. S234-5]|uniref:hypothetical protein n=1 Tax=Vibrio sp. S234-5 TaxID=1616781 RepID=UPI0005EEDF14|nr:hypothetical protein [Vibrio sp. S234-5]KJR21553.1 hypothetical protein UF06_19480 [Vibrio sp. S234-5]
MPVNTKTPFSSPKPFLPVISFKEENPYPQAKKVRQADRIAAYAKSTELVGSFLEGLKHS